MMGLFSRYKPKYKVGDFLTYNDDKSIIVKIVHVGKKQYIYHYVDVMDETENYCFEAVELEFSAFNMELAE